MSSTSVIIDLAMLVKLTLAGRTTPDAAKMAGATEAEAPKLKVSRRREKMAFDRRREFFNKYERGLGFVSVPVPECGRTIIW